MHPAAVAAPPCLAAAGGTPPAWVARVGQRLALLGRSDGSWSYRTGSARAAEPTALAALGCLAAGRVADARAAGRWLTTVQQANGSLAVSAQLASPGWPTPLAVLVWAALEEYQAERLSAVRWLLDRRGVPAPQVAHDPLGHNGALVGWPWVAATHSWVEPTALALLALGREGRADHPRAREGVRVLLDRAIPGGGWNLGNPVVFATALRPFPGPTGLALLALAQAGEARSALITRSLDYLEGMVGSTLAAESLAWAILGLRAWGREPTGAAPRLSLAAERLLVQPPPAATPTATPMGLALLLLAAQPRALAWLGVDSPSPGGTHVAR